MEDVIEALHEVNEPVPVPLQLPSHDELLDAEEAILLSLPYEMKQFMLQASDVVYGSLEPVTVADPSSHTYLPEVAAYCWDIGLSRELIPLCQVGDDCYCVKEDGEVVFWQNGELQEDSWSSVWDWVKQVWLQRY